jgi:hypothetical protein
VVTLVFPARSPVAARGDGGQPGRSSGALRENFDARDLEDDIGAVVEGDRLEDDRRAYRERGVERPEDPLVHGSLRDGGTCQKQSRRSENRHEAKGFHLNVPPMPGRAASRKPHLYSKARATW